MKANIECDAMRLLFCYIATKLRLEREEQLESKNKTKKIVHQNKKSQLEHTFHFWPQNGKKNIKFNFPAHWFAMIYTLHSESERERESTVQSNYYIYNVYLVFFLRLLTPHCQSYSYPAGNEMIGKIKERDIVITIFGHLCSLKMLGIS